jgi:hypothetical protein
MSDVLKNILDLGVKYGPEVSQYFSGQKRISDQIERERRSEMPEMQRMRATPDLQLLLNRQNRDLTAPQREQLNADFESAKEASIKTKGGLGIGNLANLLRSKAAGEAKLLQAGESARTSMAAQTAPFTQAIQKYNMGVDDQGALFDFFKDQRIGSLEDQSQRMRGRGARTLFDILGDSRGLFAKPLAENPAPDRMEQIDSLSAPESPAIEKTLLGSPKSSDMSALQKAREYGDTQAAGNELMDLLNIDVSPPEDMKSLPRKDGPLGSGVRRRPATAKSIESLLRDQVGPRRVDVEDVRDLVGLGGPGSFDFNDINQRALFKLLRR